VSRASWLVLAVGNPSRGDDALGPALLERLRDAGVDAAGDVELLTDFQLQIEHALDLQGRQAVLFVDAARPGVADGAASTATVTGMSFTSNS
jgi:hydrogenase maturation protease